MIRSGRDPVPVTPRAGREGSQTGFTAVTNSAWTEVAPEDPGRTHGVIVHSRDLSAACYLQQSAAEPSDTNSATHLLPLSAGATIPHVFRGSAPVWAQKITAGTIHIVAIDT